MTDAKRTQIKKKVAAGQARNRTKTENTTTVFDRAGEAAIDAKDKFTAFAKQHPIATVAGGLAIGILIAGMFKAPRRAAIKGGSKAAGLAAIGAELALAYAQQAMEAASEAGRAAARSVAATRRTAPAMPVKPRCRPRAKPASASARRSAPASIDLRRDRPKERSKRAKGG